MNIKNILFLSIIIFTSLSNVISQEKQSYDDLLKEYDALKLSEYRLKKNLEIASAYIKTSSSLSIR